MIKGPWTTVRGTLGWTTRPSGMARRVMPSKEPWTRSQARKSSWKRGSPLRVRWLRRYSRSASRKRASCIQSRSHSSPAFTQ